MTIYDTLWILHVLHSSRFIHNITYNAFGYRNDIRNNLFLLVFALVDLHMGSQVGSVCKLFATMSASIGFLASVRPHVTL